MVKGFNKFIYRKNNKYRKAIENGNFDIIASAPSFEILNNNDKPKQEFGHFDIINPSDSQGNLPACASFGFCNKLESILRRSYTTEELGLKKGWQLDAIRLHERCLRLVNRTNTGVTSTELMNGARGFIIPDDSTIVRLYGSAIFKEAIKEPLCIITEITENWTFASFKNGYIPKGGESRGPHLTLLVGASKLNMDNGPFIHILNSWGRRNGVDGIVTISFETFKKTLYEAFYPFFDINKWIKSEMWRNFIIYPMST